MIESLSYIFFLLSYLSTSLINPGIPELKYYSKNFNLNDKEKFKIFKNVKNVILLFLEN